MGVRGHSIEQVIESLENDSNKFIRSKKTR